MIEFKAGSYGYIAQRDIEVACDNALNHPSASAFYSQQAVEKMLKQYLREVVRDPAESIMRTHNIRRLVKAAGIKPLEPYIPLLYELTDAYFTTRYPGEDYVEMTAAEAQQFCTTAGIVCEVIALEIARHRNAG